MARIYAVLTVKTDAVAQISKILYLTEIIGLIFLQQLLTRSGFMPQAEVADKKYGWFFSESRWVGKVPWPTCQTTVAAADVTHLSCRYYRGGLMYLTVSAHPPSLNPCVPYA